MELDFLPSELITAINYLDVNSLTEIRIRLNRGISLNINGKFYYLGNKGLVDKESEAVKGSKYHIDHILDNVTEYSYYSCNDKIKEGYITTEKGVRIGLAGTCIYDGGQVLTIRDFTSLVIRLPRSVKGCADEIYNKLFKSKLANTLLISPPRRGKTTILKALTEKVSDVNNNIVIFDERGEFNDLTNPYADVIKYADKLTAFRITLRSLAPNTIITDELYDKNDWECIKKAVNSGICIITSCHGKSIDDITHKDCFIHGLFDYYVVLGKDNKPGRIVGIYDKNLNLIC